MKIYTALLTMLFGFILPISTYAQTDFEVYFDATAPFLQDNNRLIFNGARVDGFGFLPSNDALRLEYLFNYNSLNFELQMENLKIYQDVGVFHEENMAVDVEPAQPDYLVNGNTYHCGETYHFEAATSQPLVAELNLKAGHVISWLIENTSNDYLYHFTGGGYDALTLMDKSSSVISGAHIILADGLYTLKIEPRDALTLTFDLRIFNANHRKLETMANNSHISVSFEKSIRDYSKYLLHLNEGDLLTVPDPNDSHIKLKLVDSFGRQVQEVSGLPLIYQAKTSGDYYLFIQNQKGWGGSYSGTVSIRSAAEVVPRLKSLGNGRKITFGNATPAQPNALSD
jgi:hypothetical protein